MKQEPNPGYTLITGGAGFIGTNLAQRLARAGAEVLVLDNFSRAGVQANARWLGALRPSRIRVVRGDVRDAELVAHLVQGASRVFHFAAQVAVTSSLVDPIADFHCNVHGTLNVLEALRKQQSPAPLLYTSTNKVYGALPRVELRKQGRRYEPVDPPIASQGIGETQQLDFHSPYGCSKGSADQYVLDYARTFGLPAVVFRMSCIYGPHQCGNEDQGWLAHFVLRALKQEPLVLYGDGLQVRDALYVDDLVDAMQAVAEHQEAVNGRAFNMGGGPANTTSLLEAIERIEQLTGSALRLSWQAERVGDQKYYVSDTREFSRATGWAPRVSVDDGLAHLAAYLREHVIDGAADVPPLRAVPSPNAAEPVRV